MNVRDTINACLDELFISTLEEHTKESTGYKLIYPNASRLMIIIKDGHPTAIAKTTWISSKKHSMLRVKDINNQFFGCYERFSAYKPNFGMITAGELATAAEQYVQSIGTEHMHIPYETIANALKLADIELSSLNQLQEIISDSVRRTLYLNLSKTSRCVVSNFVANLLNGPADQMLNATALMSDAERGDMADTTMQIRKSYLPSLITSNSEMVADAIDAAYCSGFRHGRATATVY